MITAAVNNRQFRFPHPKVLRVIVTMHHESLSRHHHAITKNGRRVSLNMSLVLDYFNPSFLHFGLSITRLPPGSAPDSSIMGSFDTKISDTFFACRFLIVTCQRKGGGTISAKNGRKPTDLVIARLLPVHSFTAVIQFIWRLLPCSLSCETINAFKMFLLLLVSPVWPSACPTLIRVAYRISGCNTTETQAFSPAPHWFTCLRFFSWRPEGFQHSLLCTPLAPQYSCPLCWLPWISYVVALLAAVWPVAIWRFHAAESAQKELNAVSHTLTHWARPGGASSQTARQKDKPVSYIDRDQMLATPGKLQLARSSSVGTQNG